MSDDMDRFNEVVDILSRNAAIRKIEMDGGEAGPDGELLNMACRVHLQGMYEDARVKEWLTYRDEDLGLKTVPSDEFEEWGDDGMVTYVGIHDIDEDIGAEPKY